MQSRLALLSVSFFLAMGCSEVVATGTLVDGLSNQPIGEMRMIASADETVATSCSVLETYTDAKGAFTFKGLCGESTYTVKPENENIWLADGDSIPKGGAADLALKGFRAPAGRGMYRLIGSDLATIKTNADIQSEPVWNNDKDTVSYPSVIPTKPVTIPNDGYLLLVGEQTISSMTYTPLVASEERQFGSSKTKVIKMKPWSYIGVEFTSDTEFTPKTVTLDEAKVKKKVVGDRHAWWIPGDALPAGRYVVHKDGSTRTTILEFGKAVE
jgi:hypothetical protein